MKNWTDYWSSETQCACDHHKVIGYQAVFEDLKPYIKDSDIVLDFGPYSATRYLVKDSSSANRNE